MLINPTEAAKIRESLGKNNVACCPLPDIALELEKVHGIPHDRIRVLLCLAVAGGDIVILSKRQYAYYARREAEIFNEIRHS